MAVVLAIGALVIVSIVYQLTIGRLAANLDERFFKWLDGLRQRRKR